ncbi:FMN-binding glutamate synthase family protein [Candidatus Poribacteria bacterium]|nr:MAG: FMN-binding glutamate synthase family protein [Candidatus Poribacteria bacterium]
MRLSKPNRSAATLTRTRVPDVNPSSGLCVTCLVGCPGLCEVGRSAIRGREVIYPAPFGSITVGAEKDYPVDFSHFQIMGTTVGAVGVEEDPDAAIFPNVSVETAIGGDGGPEIRLRLPVVIPGLGSTDIAKRFGEAIYAGAALSGIVCVVGENVCAMDPEAEIRDGQVRRSPDMEKRVNSFKRWFDGKYGGIAVQVNVEDYRLGVHRYVIESLGVEAIEIKWGQGAKDIGGEVKLPTLERALQLKERGYLVLPDPEEPAVQEAAKAGLIKEFERHSRVGMVSEEAFMKQVEEIRDAGAKYVFLKTGAYRPRDLALALKLSSEAGIDLLTVDGAGGGTAMSPWRMMNEWGIPTVYLEALAYRYAQTLAEKGKRVPDIVIAGGLSLEDHVFKALALGAPFVKAVGMARAPLTAVHVAETVASSLEKGQVPKPYEKYGKSLEEVFYSAYELKQKLGKEFEELPKGAIGLYTFLERIKVGLQQLMCGARKFALEHLSREDIAALTEEAARITGIKHIMEIDMEEAEKILSS